MHGRVAIHHPPQGNHNMREAISIFKTWLHMTHPHEKEERKSFHPLLNIDRVQQYLQKIKDEGVNTTFAEVYAALPLSTHV